MNKKNIPGRKKYNISEASSLDGLESHINSANSWLVAQLKISKASEKNLQKKARLSTFGTNSNVSMREKSWRNKDTVIYILTPTRKSI